MKKLFDYIPRFYNLPQVIMIRWLDYEWIIQKLNTHFIRRQRWMTVFLIILQLFATGIFTYLLLLERKHCKHLCWWSDIMAWVMFLMSLIPGFGIFLSIAGCGDCARNVAEELSKRS